MVHTALATWNGSSCKHSICSLQMHWPIEYLFTINVLNHWILGLIIMKNVVLQRWEISQVSDIQYIGSMNGLVPNRWCPYLVTQICGTRFQWVKEASPNLAILPLECNGCVKFGDCFYAYIVVFNNEKTNIWSPLHSQMNQLWNMNIGFIADNL